jgi:hypothetical protein
MIVTRAACASHAATSAPDAVPLPALLPGAESVR